MVKVNVHRFAIPQVNLLELVRLEGDQINDGIELIKGPRSIDYEEIVAAVFLKKELELAYKGEQTTEKNQSADEDKEDVSINIIVLQAEAQVFGLVVDEVIDTEEVVVETA